MWHEETWCFAASKRRRIHHLEAFASWGSDCGFPPKERQQIRKVRIWWNTLRLFLEPKVKVSGSAGTWGFAPTILPTGGAATCWTSWIPGMMNAPIVYTWQLFLWARRKALLTQKWNAPSFFWKGEPHIPLEVRKIARTVRKGPAPPHDARKCSTFTSKKTDHRAVPKVCPSASWTFFDRRQTRRPQLSACRFIFKFKTPSIQSLLRTRRQLTTGLILREPAVLSEQNGWPEGYQVWGCGLDDSEAGADEVESWFAVERSEGVEDVADETDCSQTPFLQTRRYTSFSFYFPSS